MRGTCSFLASFLVVSSVACASAHGGPEGEVPNRFPEEGAYMRLARVEDVPVGRFVDISKGKRSELTLRREGDRFHLVDTGHPGWVLADGKIELAPGGRGLTLPGHHSIRFYRHGDTVVMEVLYCYLVVRAARQDGE